MNQFELYLDVCGIADPGSRSWIREGNSADLALYVADLIDHNLETTKLVNRFLVEPRVEPVQHVKRRYQRSRVARYFEWLVSPTKPNTPLTLPSGDASARAKEVIHRPLSAQERSDQVLKL